MQLSYDRAAGSRASVALFTRSMRTQSDAAAAMDLAVSLGLNHDADQRMLVLIHELEHVYDLARPLGTILTALGLRTLDEHNDVTSTINQLRPGLESDSWSKIERDVPGLVARWAGASCLATALVEVELILLEGIAAHCERTHAVANGPELSAGMDILVSLRHQVALTNPGVRQRAADKSPHWMLFVHWAEVCQELQAARESVGTRQLTTRLFFAPDDEGASPSNEHYFLGYSLVHRLLDQWSRGNDAYSPGELLHGVRRIAGEVLPFLALSCIEDVGIAEASLTFQSRVDTLLQSLPTMESEELEALTRGAGMATWDPSTSRVQLWTSDLAGVEQFIDEAFRLAFSGARQQDAVLNHESMVQIDQGKQLQLLSSDVVELGHLDSERMQLLLRLDDGSDPPHVTVFEIDPSLSAVSTGEELDTETRPPRGRLDTYMQTWPGASPADSADPRVHLEVVAVRRRLEALGRVLMERGSSADLFSLITQREDWHKRVEETMVTVTLDPKTQIEDIGLTWGFLDDERVQAALDAFVTAHSSQRGTVHHVVREMLYPQVAQEAEPAQRFSVLYHRLLAQRSDAAASIMWRLLNASVQGRDIVLADLELPSITDLQRESLAILGVPFARLIDDNVAKLDLVPQH